MVPLPQVVFNGSRDEAVLLLDILARNCECQMNGMRQITVACAGHVAVATDQHFVDYLVFVRRMRAYYLAAEFALEA